jgi:hypothetical protein
MESSMILKRAACWIVSITACAFLRAQIPGSPANLQSPNMASLGLYGDIPVSLFTGSPSIEIPLYTIEERDIKIPLSLSYHFAGGDPNRGTSVTQHFFRIKSRESDPDGKYKIL